MGPTGTWMPTLAGAYLHAHSLIKARILSICFQNFTIWHLCTSRTHLNVAIISVFLANIWYLIKLIRSIIIILRVFMFYKQRVLANFWGRKDSAIWASRKRSGHYFTIWHLCTSRTHRNVAIISLFLANIWYLIKLIHSIIIILRVFMFYKQRVLANFWCRKDSATCASRKRNGACYCAEHMKWAMNSLFMPTALSFRPQKSAKTRYIYNINMRKMIIIDWINKIKYQMLAKIQL